MTRGNLIILIIFCVMAGMFLGAMSYKASNPPILAEAIQDWRVGELPLDVPVVGIWLYEGEIVTMPVVRTEYAGILEYALVRRYSRSMPAPNFWAPLPEGL